MSGNGKGGMGLGIGVAETLWQAANFLSRRPAHWVAGAGLPPRRGLEAMGFERWVPGPLCVEGSSHQSGEAEAVGCLDK